MIQNLLMESVPHSCSTWRRLYLIDLSLEWGKSVKYLSNFAMYNLDAFSALLLEISHQNDGQ